MDTHAPELLTMVPRTRFSRRGFVVTSLASGFALAAGPVSAETITTDTNGLDAGEVKVPTADGEMVGLPGDAGNWAVRSRPCWWSWRCSASTSTSRTSAAVSPKPATTRSRRSSMRARATLEIYRHSETDLRDRRQGADRRGDERPRRDGRLCEIDRQGGYDKARRHRVLLGRVHDVDVRGASAGAQGGRRLVRRRRARSPT
jgi:hypothetical protein